MPFSGSRTYIWRVFEMDGANVVSEERYPLRTMDEAAITKLIQEKSEQPVHRVEASRSTLSSGTNPRYTASLWPIEELIRG